MTLLLQQFIVQSKQPLPYYFSLEHTLAEYLFPDARFAIAWFDPSSAYDAAPLESFSLQCVERDRGYYSDAPIREQLHLKTDFSAAKFLFHSCQTPIQECAVRLKVVEDGSHSFEKTGSPVFVGAAHGKVSFSLAEVLTQSTSAAFRFALGIQPQADQGDSQVAIGTLAPDAHLAPCDLILPLSCFRGLAPAVGDYCLTVGVGILELAIVQQHPLGPTILVNYPNATEAEFLPRLQAQAENLAQIQRDPRDLAQHYLNHQRMVSKPGLPLPNAESNWFEQFLQTDLKHYLQILEHPYVTSRLAEFGQSCWSAIAAGNTLTAPTAIAQPELMLQPDEISVPDLPDCTDLIVLKLPPSTSNDAQIMRNRCLPTQIKNCVYLHPDAAAKFGVDFGGDRLAFLPVAEYPTFAAEITASQVADNNYSMPGVAENAPSDGDLTCLMPTRNSTALDTMIQQTNQIWATAPPLQPRSLIQFNPLFPPVEETTDPCYSYYEQLARELYRLRSAPFSAPALAAYQIELDSVLKNLTEHLSDSEPSISAGRLWHWFHTRKQSDLTHPEELELAKLIFLSFPKPILDQLKSFQLMRLKVTGLQYFTNKHLGRNWESQPVPIALSQNSIPNSPNYCETLILVENEVLGRLTAQSPQLPIGTAAIATIHPLATAIVVATTSDGVTFQIRTHASKPLETHALVSLEITSRPSTQNPAELLWDVKVEGEAIGILCRRSVHLLRNLRRLHTGSVFEVTLQPPLPETAWVELDPSSVRYPQTWQHRIRR